MCEGNMCRQSLLLFWMNIGHIVQGSPVCSMNGYIVDVNTCRQCVPIATETGGQESVP